MEQIIELGKNGYLYIYDEFRGENSKVLRSFLRDTFTNFANFTMKYLRTEDCNLYPFLYNEMVLNSIFLPSLMKASDESVVLLEFPVDRNKNFRREKDEYSNGRVDFYVRHKSRDILIEHKFAWISYKSLNSNNPIKKDLLEKLTTASNQIKEIDWDSCIKIALLTAPVYIVKTVQSEKEFKEAIKKLDFDNLNKVYDDYYQKLDKVIRKTLGKNTQSFLVSWDIPNFKNYYCCWENDEKERCEAYPVIFFIGAVLK